jgi:hypothetical protein
MRVSSGDTPTDAERETRASIDVVVHIETIDGHRKVRELQLHSV